MRAGPALAAGLCDPAGQFCVQVDATSATVCAPLRPGGWNTATCEQADGELRASAKRVDEASHGAIKEVDALIIRFEDWRATASLYRSAAESEVTGDAGPMSSWTQRFEGARKAGWLFEEVKPPALSRTNGVQVARQEVRLSSAGVGGAKIGHAVTYEARTRDATYLVTFSADESQAPHLLAMADASMATLDALPVTSAASAVPALVWLLRALVAAAVLVGVGWLVSRRRGGRGGIDSRDLWPR
jgi:hypothetical protein